MILFRRFKVNVLGPYSRRGGLSRHLNKEPGQCRSSSSESRHDCDLLRCCGGIIHLLAFTDSREQICTVKSYFSTYSPSNMASPPDSSSSHQDNANKVNPGNSSQSPTPKFRATKEELKARLSPIQYQVTQLKATERPGTGEYNKFNKKGTYHCIVCDEELFKSETKFDSGCGWPAFFDSVSQDKLKFVQDYALVGSSNLLLLAKNTNLIRTEVLCKNCDAHLGHRFDDGPISKGGKRYCINSASLRFEPAPESN